jgi:hypothetical protein
MTLTTPSRILESCIGDLYLVETTPTSDARIPLTGPIAVGFDGRVGHSRVLFYKTMYGKFLQEKNRESSFSYFCDKLPTSFDFRLKQPKQDIPCRVIETLLFAIGILEGE